MHRAHKIRLVPNAKQLTALKKAAGIARYVYNWTLAEWKKQYEEFKEGKTTEKPGPFKLARQWTRERPDWAHESAVTLQTQAILNVGIAFTNMWKHKKATPVFKKKAGKQSFYVGNAKAYVKNGRIHLPLIGKVKLREQLRFQGKILSYTVSCEAGQWHASVRVEVPDPITSSNSSVVGVDVGIKNIAVASDGNAIPNPKNLSKKQHRIKRFQRKLSRQVKGSNRRNQTKLSIAKVHKRIVNQRNDSIHKFTTALAKNHGTAVVETLDISAMVESAPKWCRHSFQDTAMREFHRQLEYKMHVERAPKYYLSSKTCSRCGYILEELTLSMRIYICPRCGMVKDRDRNAADNLSNMPWVTGLKRVEPSKGAMKRETETATTR